MEVDVHKNTFKDTEKWPGIEKKEIDICGFSELWEAKWLLMTSPVILYGHFHEESEMYRRGDQEEIIC